MVEIATFAAGCFWGVEDAFINLPGVLATRVGYCGGITENPTYSEVCNMNTGHAEAVEVTFDTSILSFEQLLKVFWECHDPTQLNRQGPDFGEQYRSVIFYHSEYQLDSAVRSQEKLESNCSYRRSIVTKIQPAETFWEAEVYHQKYHQKNGVGCGF